MHLMESWYPMIIILIINIVTKPHIMALGKYDIVIAVEHIITSYIT